jgi:hypothetical protein
VLRIVICEFMDARGDLVGPRPVLQTVRVRFARTQWPLMSSEGVYRNKFMFCKYEKTL